MADSAVTTPDTAEEQRAVAYLYEVIDAVIADFAGDAHSEEVGGARKYYEDRRGRVFEDEELWERWTQAFLEWYAVERPQASGAPPVLLYADRTDDARRARAARAWATSHRSLFEVRELNQGRVELLDLLGGGLFSVAEKRALVGVSPGDVAEMRLIGFADEVVFGRTFCFHPPGTRAAILRHNERIRTGGGTRRDVIDYCASLRIRYERYRHVAPERLYESGTGDSAANDRQRRE